jgi:hypothetical protein
MPRKHNGLLPQPNETREEALARYMGDSTASDKETSTRPNSHSRLPLRAAVAASVGVLAATAFAESPVPAKIVNNTIDSLRNAYVGPSAPKSGEGTTITIGDFITYRDSDGKMHKKQIRFLSDITAVARAIDPNTNYGTFENMLESENTENPVTGDANYGQHYTVDTNLGIKDIGPSADG